MFSQPDQDTYSGTGEGGASADETRALDRRFTELYDKIRGLAARVRWNGTNLTLNPTALAHEAYLKLRNDSTDMAAKSYDQVIAIFANAMHQILIDAARRKNAQKRVVAHLPEQPDVPIEDALFVAESMEALQRENPVQARVVQCRFLLGMTIGETAAALRLSKRTVERHRQEAKERLSARTDAAAR